MPRELSIGSSGSSAGQVFSDRRRTWRTRWVLFILLGASLAIGAAFYRLLGRDPHLVGSPLIGRPVPQFSLPPVKGRPAGLASMDLKGEVSLVNVFAS